MVCDLYTTVAYDASGANEIDRASDRWPRLGRLLAGVDTAFEWVTERLDRKFVTAMERCHKESPDKKREVNLLKRIILVLMCLGLGISALSMKFTTEADMVISLLG